MLGLTYDLYFGPICRCQENAYKFGRPILISIFFLGEGLRTPPPPPPPAPGFASSAFAWSVCVCGGGGALRPHFPTLLHPNQGIYRYFLFPFKKSEMKIGKATYFLFSIDNLQTKIGKGLNFRLPIFVLTYSQIGKGL